MKIIDVIELNKNGVEVGKEGNPMAIRYFDDNGGLPDGNYDEDNIEGVWVLIDGKENNFDVYAYRTIDDCTLVPIEEFIKDKLFINESFYQTDGQNFVDGIEWEKLAEHYGVELNNGIGWNVPKAEKLNPSIRDNKYYCKIRGEEKYIRVDGEGDHDLVEEIKSHVQWS